MTRKLITTLSQGLEVKNKKGDADVKGDAQEISEGTRDAAAKGKGRRDEAKGQGDVADAEETEEITMMMMMAQTIRHRRPAI